MRGDGSLARQNVRMALESLLSTKLRSLLTLLGLMIGVGTVIAMMAIVSGLNGAMRKQIASLGSGVLYVSKHEAGIHFGGPVKPRRDLTLDDALSVAEFCPSVDVVSPEIQDRAFLSFGRTKTSVVSLYGASMGFCEVNDWFPEEGRYFTPADLRAGSRVCVLGRSPADVLFPHGGAVGQWIDVEGIPCQVVGILRAKGKFLGQDMDNTVLLPLPVVAKARQYNRTIDYFVVRPLTPELTDVARDEITELLRRRRGVRADQPDDFGITSQEALLDIYRQVTGAFFLVTILLSSIGLMVGGIGVMNMMLVSVKERTREVGVRAALGARRRDILAQFLTEAVTLTLVGGLLGIGLGYGLAFVLRLIFKVPLAASLPGILIALGISAGVGIFFGWYPAWRASRLDPIEALRYE